MIKTDEEAILLAVKILHAADFHMDSPFDALPGEKASLRRREQRDMLKKIAQIVNDEGVQVVLLSGDLFDSDASYYDTGASLIEALASMNAEVFISPGNHDYFCPKSPYSYLKFPENVHVFKTPIISSVTLNSLGVRVYGAGFASSDCPPLLDGFRAEEDGLINLMVLHGELNGDRYNPVSARSIAESRLNYLALGHVHSYSGIGVLSGVAYAYPGCPEGRGFDETGEKGVILGTVTNTSIDLHFRPLGGRQYKIYDLDVTGYNNLVTAVSEYLPKTGDKDNIVRVILRGLYSGTVNTDELASAVAGRFFHVTFRDETRFGSDIWDGCGEDTLTGLFLLKMRKAYEAAQTGEEREKITMAVRYGLAALENREEWRP